MENQGDRLARIAAEGFAMIDELYGRPKRGGPRNPLAQGQGVVPPPYYYYKGNPPVLQTGSEAMNVNVHELAKKHNFKNGY